MEPLNQRYFTLIPDPRRSLHNGRSTLIELEPPLTPAVNCSNTASQYVDVRSHFEHLLGPGQPRNASRYTWLSRAVVASLQAAATRSSIAASVVLFFMAGLTLLRERAYEKSPQGLRDAGKDFLGGLKGPTSSYPMELS
jgi:hypothetical protein